MTLRPPLVSEQLRDRLVAEGIVPPYTKCVIERIRLTRLTRAAGGWQWSASWRHRNAGHSAGSQWSMRACVDAPLLLAESDRTGMIHITPCRPPSPPRRRCCPVCGRDTGVRTDGAFRAHRMHPQIPLNCPLSQRTPEEEAEITLDREQLRALILRGPGPEFILLGADRYARHSVEASRATVAAI